MKIKKGDTVMCMGDEWMDAGAVGRVILLRDNQASAAVEWHTLPSGSKKTMRSLYHMTNILTTVIDNENPNFAFQRRKQK